MFKYACLLNESGDQKKGREIAYYYKIAADNGHVSSMLNYAMMSLNGNGIPKNVKEAFKYLKRAADLGNENAIFLYGIKLMKGDEIQENLEEAAKYLKKSADLFNINAMFFYGEMLINGDGVKKNVDEGIDYIKRSADDDNDLNDDDLKCYVAQSFIHRTNNFPQNVEIGLKYLQKSCEKLNIDAIKSYSKILHEGILTERNDEKALDLLNEIPYIYQHSIPKLELAKTIFLMNHMM